MRALVKWIRIDHRAKRGSDYKKVTNEDVWDDLPETDDNGDVGQAIHDQLNLNRRWFIKVLGFKRLDPEG